MSDPNVPRRARAPHPSRRDLDRGSTLPELLITVMLLGVITVSLASAMIVIFRQQDNTEGRLNVARAEQNVGIWVPSDLASAESVDVAPGASPCGTACPPGAQTGGSNSLMLTWDTLEPGATSAMASITNVSYRYVEVDGDFRLIRVECTSVDGAAWSCQNNTVLTGLTAPPPGTPWEPGITTPDWVIRVSEPLDPEDTSAPDTDSTVPIDPAAPSKNAKRVIVTIDGGGDAGGAGGGLNVISLSAGGTTRNVIDSTSLAGTPSFTEARTRCGGTYGLIIDKSGSIGSQMVNIRNGVIQFINAFAGTPIRLQVVRFDSTAAVLGQDPRTRYFDMLNPSDVSTLRTLVGGLTAGGGTNWEDALHRMLFDQNGAILQTVPDKVLFFTDGEPNGHRATSTSTSAATAPIEPPARQALLGVRQESFNRAKFIVDRFRADVDFIGVGVGPAFQAMGTWVEIGPGFHWDHFRGFHYERRASSTAPWVDTDLATYNSTPPADRRISYASPYQHWEPTTLAIYNTLPSAGRSRTKDYSLPFETYDTITTSVRNSVMLSRLIAGDDTGIPAQLVNGQYINSDVANMYLLPEFSQFTAAMEAVALAECGGTLTLQTRVGSTAAADPFTYQHSASRNSADVPIQTSGDVVTTTRSFPSGTFDFSIPNGEFVTVEIQPVDLSLLTRYTHVSWTCTAGGVAKPITTFQVPNTAWTGIRVQVRANEAVSCVQSVNRV